MLDIFTATYRIAPRTDHRRTLSARDVPGPKKRRFWQRLNRPIVEIDLDKL